MYDALRNPIATIIAVIALLLFVVVGSAFIPARTADASARQDVCRSIGGSGNANAGNCSTPGPTVQGTLRTVINILSVLIGTAAVIMIIIGGLRYVTSGGDSNATKGARDTIIYAIVGLIIVAISQAIVRLVLSRV